MDNRLIIVGAGGHGKVVAEIAKLVNYDSIIFLDSDASLIGKHIGHDDIEVCGTPMDIDDYDGDIFIAIGDPVIRKKMIDSYKSKNRTIATLIHPSAVISEDVIIEDGVVIMAGAVINTSTTIKTGCIINTCSSVDHDCYLDQYCHVAPGAHLCGGIRISNCCWIGAGATIVNNVSLTDNVTIGAGAVVIRDILESGTYVGVPAKRK